MCVLPILEYLKLKEESQSVEILKEELKKAQNLIKLQRQSQICIQSLPSPPPIRPLSAPVQKMPVGSSGSRSDSNVITS